MGQDVGSLEQHISEALDVAQQRKEHIKEDVEHLTTVTEFSQYVETRTNNSPEKPQPAREERSESPRAGEAIANETTSELREFKMNEKMVSDPTEIHLATQTLDQSSMERDYQCFLDLHPTAYPARDSKHNFEPQILAEASSCRANYSNTGKNSASNSLDASQRMPN